MGLCVKTSHMKAAVAFLILVVLFVYGGPHVAVAFLSLPILFVLAVGILAVWKILDFSKTTRA